MNVYVYCLREDYKYQSSITGREFENEWFKLSQDGTVLVKGTTGKGYAWDGCSPKMAKFKDLYFGTPEAVLNFETGQSKTYYASLIHAVRGTHHLIHRLKTKEEIYGDARQGKRKRFAEEGC